MILERDVERAYCRKVKAAGGLAIKMLSPTMSGLPDRLILMPSGVMWFVEFKRPGGRPRALQVKVIERLRALGFKVKVVDSMGEEL